MNCLSTEKYFQVIAAKAEANKVNMIVRIPSVAKHTIPGPARERKSKRLKLTSAFRLIQQLGH